MSEDSRTINPDTVTTHVGNKKLRPITIYPLSIQDQMKLTDVFSETVQKFSEFDRESMTNKDVIDFMKSFLSENLPQFMEFVVDPDENEVPGLYEVTNNQLAEIADIVFRINYEDLIKNFKNLFERAQTAMSQSQ